MIARGGNSLLQLFPLFQFALVEYIWQEFSYCSKVTELEPYNFAGLHTLEKEQFSSV